MDRSVVINDLSEGWSMGSLISREIAEIGRAQCWLSEGWSMGSLISREIAEIGRAQCCQLLER